jgi:phosphoribosyl 1,2-cyclic phosphodiesterase
MLDFQVIASSSAGCAYRVSGGGASRPLLIDCGLSFPKLQKALDYKVTDLAGCLISHSHLDHCKAANSLAKFGVDIWSSEETIGSINKDGTYSRRYHSMRPGMWYAIGDWQVLAFDAVHDKDGTFGFIVGSPAGERLLYLTDTCYCPKRFDGLTHIAVEANHSMAIMRANVAAGKLDLDRFDRTAHTHMSIERLLEMLKANDLSRVQRIWLLHLSALNSNAEEFKAIVEETTGIPTTVCEA